MFHKLAQFTNKHRIVRGVLSYTILWPCGNLIEQTLVEKKNFRTYDWKRVLRFGLFGFFIMGPTMYMYMRIANVMWPKTDIKSSLCKALTEQVAYDPFMIATFFFGMSLMEGKTATAAREEVSSKFFDTYKVGMIYWPLVQTCNFALIPSKNQVVFTSIFSMFWTSFLAYAKASVDLDYHIMDVHDLHFHHHH